MRPSAILSVLLACGPTAFADVLFTSPAAGALIPGGTQFTVSWQDSGSPPALVDLTGYQLFLYSGSNAQPQRLPLDLPNGAFSAGSTIQVTVPVAAGGTGTNVYFLGILSNAAAGGTITNFSPRFTLTGMTGQFPANVIASNVNIVGTTGPPAINQVANANPNPAAGASTGQGLWGTPYNEQVGPTRYAPMQPVPPTKITATNTAPLWPTSSVPIATTFLPPLGSLIVTTQTQAQTFSVASHPNTAAPQSNPTDDMQKFLNRWKD